MPSQTLHFPDSLAAKHGHVTKFYSIKYKLKICVWIPERLTEREGTL